MLLKHVVGIIQVGNRHAIIYSRRTGLKKIRQICQWAFPEITSPDDWVWEDKPVIGVKHDAKSNLNTVPKLFARAIKAADEEHDWEKLPYMALESKGGIIESRPLSIT